MDTSSQGWGHRGKGENGKGGTGTLNVNLEALITSMILKAAQLMSYPSICNCGSGDWGNRRHWRASHNPVLDCGHKAHRLLGKALP